MAQEFQRTEKPQEVIASWPQRLARRVSAGEVGSLPVLIGLILIAIVFQAANKNFLSPLNLTNLLVQIASMGTLSVGIVLVLLIGEIDLSVGSVSGLCALISSTP